MTRVTKEALTRAPIPSRNERREVIRDRGRCGRDLRCSLTLANNQSTGTDPMLASLVPSRGDVFGGISAGIVALPLCLAFGAISGLGPEAGLYGAIAAGILAAIFGGSKVLVTGPTNPMTLVAATVVAANTPPGGTINLAVVMTAFLLAGALQVLLGRAAPRRLCPLCALPGDFRFHEWNRCHHHHPAALSDRGRRGAFLKRGHDPG